MVDAPLEHTATVPVGSHLDTVCRDRIVYELFYVVPFRIIRWQRKRGVTNLVILGRQLVQAFLYDMIAVKILNQNNDVQTQRDNNRVYLRVVSKISLLSLTRKQYKEIGNNNSILACLCVDRKSIIFCTARVPCMLSEMLTKSCATDSQMTFLCSSVENSRSFWQR